jgi:hypothetical protein
LADQSDDDIPSGPVHLGGPVPKTSKRARKRLLAPSKDAFSFERSRADSGRAKIMNMRGADRRSDRAHQNGDAPIKTQTLGIRTCGISSDRWCLIANRRPRKSNAIRPSVSMTNRRQEGRMSSEYRVFDDKLEAKKGQLTSGPQVAVGPNSRSDIRWPSGWRTDPIGMDPAQMVYQAPQLVRRFVKSRTPQFGANVQAPGALFSIPPYAC